MRVREFLRVCVCVRERERENRRIAVLLAEDPLAREDPRDPTSKCVCGSVRECESERVIERVRGRVSA